MIITGTFLLLIGGFLSGTKKREMPMEDDEMLMTGTLLLSIGFFLSWRDEEKR